MKFTFLQCLGLGLLSLVNAIILQSSDGTGIFADAIGNPKNPPIVFVHTLTLSALVFKDLFQDERLLDHFYLVSYDMRGHGRSGMPNTTAAYASNLFADDFATVINHFNVKSPLFVGWSFGATVVSDIFTNLPPRTISGIVAINGVPVNGFNINTPATMAIVEELGVTNDVAVAVNGRLAFITSFFNDSLNIPIEIIWSWLGSAVIQLPPITDLIGGRTQNSTKLFEAGLQGFPYLAIVGAADKVLFNNNITAEVQPHFTNFEMVSIQGGSHAVFIEHQDEFVRALVPFANKILGA